MTRHLPATLTLAAVALVGLVAAVRGRRGEGEDDAADLRAFALHGTEGRGAVVARRGGYSGSLPASMVPPPPSVGSVGIRPREGK